MGYRTSIIKTAGYIVLGAVLSLKEGNLEEIKMLTRKLSEQRTSKQPLEYPSAGSTFKRPEGYFAGQLSHGQADWRVIAWVEPRYRRNTVAL